MEKHKLCTQVINSTVTPPRVSRRSLVSDSTVNRRTGILHLNADPSPRPRKPCSSLLLRIQQPTEHWNACHGPLQAEFHPVSQRTSWYSGRDVFVFAEKYENRTETVEGVSRLFLYIPFLKRDKPVFILFLTYIRDRSTNTSTHI